MFLKITALCLSFTLFVHGTDSDYEIVHPCTDFGFKRAIRQPDIAAGFIGCVASFF